MECDYRACKDLDEYKPSVDGIEYRLIDITCHHIDGDLMSAQGPQRSTINGWVNKWKDNEKVAPFIVKLNRKELETTIHTALYEDLHAKIRERVNQKSSELISLSVTR